MTRRTLTVAATTATIGLLLGWWFGRALDPVQLPTVDLEHYSTHMNWTLFAAVAGPFVVVAVALAAWAVVTDPARGGVEQPTTTCGAGYPPYTYQYPRPYDQDVEVDLEPDPDPTPPQPRLRTVPPAWADSQPRQTR